MKDRHIIFVVIFSALVAFTSGVSLSPTTWPKGSLEHYYELDDASNTIKGDQGKMNFGAATGTSSAMATYVAQDCLSKGGSAVDCAYAAAMTQITIAGGSYVSFAGISSFVYYDAATQQTVTLNGYWNAPKGETNPVTMPPPGSFKDIGRAVLVTGFFRAMEAAHEKYGKLPWATLFEPAIYFAKHGFPFTNMLFRQLKAFQSVAMRTPEGQALFTNPQTGKMYQHGELFTQPDLADVLSNVAVRGADYIYRGDFAQKLVSAVQAANGTITMDDLKAYKPTWSKPLTTTYNGYEVNTLTYPSYGGLGVVEALNLLEHVDFTTIGRYNESAAALFQMIQMARWSPLVYLIGSVNPVGLQKAFPGIDMSWKGRTTKQTAQSVWNIMNGPNGKKEIDQRLKSAFPGGPGVELLARDPKHSDGFICIDSEGNALSMVHSINSMPWGTGIFVKGIALSNAGSINILQLMQAGPGGRVPDPLEPTIMTQNGKPVYISTSIGGGVHEIDLQNFVNIAQFGISATEANTMPHFFSINFGGDYTKFPANQSLPVGGRGFSLEIVTEVIAMGQPITEVPIEASSTSTPGFWAGAVVEYDKKKVEISAPYEFNGWAVVV